jgi:outer membrane protein assembly factor BamA
MVAALFCACAVGKYVPEGQKLYKGAEIKITSNNKTAAKEKSELLYKLEETIYPMPNSSFLGLQPGLWSYYKIQKGDSGKVVQWVYKKYGEKPIYLNDVNPEKTVNIILNRCENSGFFNSDASFDVKDKKKSASILYDVNISSPYQLSKYTYLRDSLPIDAHISKAVERSGLKPNVRFDLDYLTNERARIDQELKNKGYYNFNADYLIFTTDTHQYNTRKFDLYLDVKKGIPATAQIPYKIRKVIVYPNHNQEVGKKPKADTLLIDGYYFVQDSMVFKPNLLKEYITLSAGDLYSNKARLQTTKRLSALEMYEFVNIICRPIDSISNENLGYLDAHIMLSRRKTIALRQEIKAVTKSTNFAGPGIDLSYKNRNLLQGGEVYKLALNGAYETQIATGNAQTLSSYQIQLLNSLTVPRMLSPFKIKGIKKYSVPKTKIQLNYTLQNRTQFYRLNSFLGALSYQWSSSKHTVHELSPLSLNYTLVGSKTDAFNQILDANPFLARSFENQFIPGITYTFQYSDLGKKKAKHTFNLSFNADLAGNIIGATQGIITGGNEILGLPYAQYAKTDVDLRYYLKTSEKTKWVSRLFVGVGLPYGNSSSLPYIKQYFAGGPGSIRAFQVRSLGPGAYKPANNTSTTFFDQAGDIRLEANTEYRFPLVSYLKGAFFIDAGNIWLANENTAIPNSRFTAQWYQQIAIGTGLGLRLDIDFLAIRLDAGVPVRYPYEIDNNSQWQQNYFSSWAWTKDHVVLNFAIGYPF